MSMDFKFTWERFINGFDAIEEAGGWNKEEYGEMEVYCENILISVIMHFIAVDGKVTQTEVDTLNKLFDFDFSFEYVQDLCYTMDDELDDYVETPNQLIEVIAQANEKIAKDFKILLVDACNAIIESDDVSISENDELKELINNLNK